MRPNVVIAVALVVLAVAFAGFAIFYWTTKTSLLASAYALHTKHALLFTALAVLSLIAANFARRAGAAGSR